MVSIGSFIHYYLIFNLLIVNKNTEVKSKLLLNPLFPTLKKEIIQLFIVSLPKVPEFWCSFFSNTKLLIFGNFYFIIGKSLNSFDMSIYTLNKKDFELIGAPLYSIT